MIIHEPNKFDGHRDSVNLLCFSPDGTTLASGSDYKSIRLWDVKIGQQKTKLDGHVYSICFSLKDTKIASGSGDYSIRLWDIKTGKEIQSSDKSYKDILYNLTLHYFKAIVSEKKQTLILQYYLYPKHQQFKHKELQSFKGNLQIIKVQIYNHSQNQNEVTFQKVNVYQQLKQVASWKTYQIQNKRKNDNCMVS